MTNDDVRTTNNEQVWYTLAEAAAYLRVTRQTIYLYMKKGLLPYYKLKSGRGRRLRRADLDGVLEPPRTRGEGEDKAE